MRQGTFNEGKFYRRKKELTDDQLTEIKDSFDLFTKDKEDGGVPRIDAEDLLVVMRALGHEPRKEDLKKLVTEVDTGNTGQLDFDGCARCCWQGLEPRTSLPAVRRSQFSLHG